MQHQGKTDALSAAPRPRPVSGLAIHLRQTQSLQSWWLGLHLFCGSLEVAQAEYENMWKGLRGADQPVTVFHAEVSLKHALDLTAPATLKAFKFTNKILLAPWRRAKKPMLTQMVGQAVYETRWFSAIRYPSAAAFADGSKGSNIVIFRACLDKKDSVRILGPKDRILAQWP